MAQKIKYEPFKRGDTPGFTFQFSAPYIGYNWSNVRISVVITNEEEPTNNTGAGVVRLDQPLTVDAANTASYRLQPTIAESRALAVGLYTVEAQLTENNVNVVTPIVGEVKVLQDYVV